MKTKTLGFVALGALVQALLPCAALADGAAAADSQGVDLALDIARGFSYSPPPPGPDLSAVQAPPTPAKPDGFSAAQLLGIDEPALQTPMQMPAFQVREPSERALSGDFEVSLATADFIAPCVLYKADLRHSRELEALGAPIAPIPGENYEQTLQARFPIFVLAW